MNMLFSSFSISLYLLCFYLLAVTSCRDTPYRNYQEVVKESKQPINHNKTSSLIKLIPIKSNLPKSLSYDVPARWKEAPAGNMVMKAFDLKSGSKVTLSAFSGSVGGVAANINRWARQINLSNRDKINQVLSSLSQDRGNHPYVLVSFLSVTSGYDQSTMAGVFQFQDKTLFVKLFGPSQDLELEKAEFISFLKSIR